MRTPAPLCSFAFLVASVAPVAAGGTISVPKQHATIQAAIDAAVDGDVIVVSKGTYEQNLLFDNKTNVTLKAKKKHKVIVDGQENDDAITVYQSSGIVIDDLIVQWGDWFGIKIDESSDVEVTNCTVRWSGGDGIHVESSNDVRILDNKVHECAWGGDPVRLESTTNSLVEGNKLSGDGAGVVLDSSDGTAVHKNDIEWCQNGIEVAGEGNLIAKNDIRAIVDRGIVVDDTAVGTTVRDNKIEACGEQGIFVESNGTTVNANEVESTGDDGIRIEADSCTVTDNTVKKPIDDGYRIEGSFTTVTGNKAIQAGNDGFTITSTNNTLTDNLSTKNRSNGFQVEDENNVFTNNKATKNGFFDLFDNTNPGGNTYSGNTWKTEKVP